MHILHQRVNRPEIEKPREKYDTDGTVPIVPVCIHT